MFRVSFVQFFPKNKKKQKKDRRGKTRRLFLERKKERKKERKRKTSQKNSSSHQIIIMLGARQSDVFFGERESGKDVRQNNATAVQAVANIVKSSLGPVGLDKVRLCSRRAILIFDFSIFFFSSSSSSLL